MRIFHFIAAAAAALLSALPQQAQAQQLPNNGFEEAWSDCTPWTSNNNTKTKGKNPASWCISHVIGVAGTGATVVGKDSVGCNSNKSVLLFNAHNPFKKAQIVPGYMGFGTTWSTSKGGIFSDPTNKDGGIFGGLCFAKRPDAISFDFEKSKTGTDAAEASSIIAYTWKGHTSQADVPAQIVLTGSPATVTMTDRERNILGIATSEGGAVTKSDDFALVSVINQSLTGGSATEWTNKLVEFEYKTDDIPGMINVIFSVTDYFSQPTTAQDYNKLAVDNVKLVYYSRLRSLSFDGAVLESFSPDVYSYALDVDALPADEAEALALVDYELLGGGKSASTAVTYAVTGEHTGAVTVTVTGVDADADGLASHTYTIALAEVPDLGSWTEVFHGTLSIKMGGSEIGGDGQYTVYIVSSTDDPGRCTFSLKDFSLSMDGGESFMYLGDIVVPQVLMTYNDIRPQGAAGPAVSPLYYKGNVDGMELPVRTEPGAEPAGTLTANVGLTGQVAPKVDDQGQPVTDDQGRTVRHAEMNIDVTWLQDPADPSANVPIAVKFAGDRDEQQTTGVEGVSAESGSAPQGPCRYYDLQGRPAAASAAGLLIEVAPDGAARTILRR